MKLKDCAINSRALLPQDATYGSTPCIATVFQQISDDDSNDTLLGWKAGEMTLNFAMSIEEFANDNTIDLLRSNNCVRGLWISGEMEVETYK